MLNLKINTKLPKPYALVRKTAGLLTKHKRLNMIIPAPANAVQSCRGLFFEAGDILTTE